MSREIEMSPNTDIMVEITVEIPLYVNNLLQEMAFKHGEDFDRELEQIIVDRTFLENKMEEGAEVLLRFPNGNITGLRFYHANDVSDDANVASDPMPDKPNFIRRLFRGK